MWTHFLDSSIDQRYFTSRHLSLWNFKLTKSVKTN